jgi:tetratricopeptide (TPR) repeat protein
MNQDNRGALADLDSVLAKGKNESAYFNRGILRNELKEYPLAILDFQEAINLNAACLKCYYSMGLANYHARLFRQAIRSFSTCIEMDPVSGSAYYYRALSYKETGNPDSCCNDLKKAVNLGLKEAEPSLEQYCR